MTNTYQITYTHPDFGEDVCEVRANNLCLAKQKYIKKIRQTLKKHETETNVNKWIIKIDIKETE